MSPEIPEDSQGPTNPQNNALLKRPTNEDTMFQTEDKLLILNKDI